MRGKHLQCSVDFFPPVVSVWLFVFISLSCTRGRGGSDHKAKCYNLLYNEVKQLQWEAPRAWLLPSSPDNGASSWFKCAPAERTLVSDANQFRVCVQSPLLTPHMLLQIWRAGSGATRWHWIDLQEPNACPWRRGWISCPNTEVSPPQASVESCRTI